MSETRSRKTFRLDAQRLIDERMARREGKKKFTQQDMADLLDIGLATLKKAEAGDCLDERIARQILTRLDLDAADLGFTPCDAAPDQDPTLYLHHLHNDCAFIDVRGLIVGSGKAPRLNIGEVYIPLTTTGSSGARGLDAPRTVSLDESLTHRKLVIVGDPGGGKSTYLKWLAWKCSGPGSTQFPILVRIFALEAFIHKKVHSGAPDLPDSASADWLPLYLEALSAEFSWNLDADFFRRKLREAFTLILLDGLDEIPDSTRRAHMARWFERAAAAFRDARFVVTTRPATYEGKSTLDDFETVRIGDLDLPAMEDFLAKWSGFLFSQDATAARSLTGELISALRGRPEIRRMARNPLMLTALAVIQWNDRRLPDQRADLYESILKWLSEARDYPNRPPGHRVLSIFGRLALEMQRRPGGRVKQLERDAAAKIIEPEFREVPADQRFEAALDFLVNETLYSGIVVSRGDSTEYWHLTFQEYLAARRIAALEPEKLLFEEDRWLKQEWREVLLLVPGVLIRNGMERVDAIFTEALARTAGPGVALSLKARAAGLLGAARQDLRAWKYEPPDDAPYQELLTEIRSIFERGKAEKIDLRVRLEAAEALGQAGDWRFQDGHDNWILLPGGTFTMGSQKKLKKSPNYDPETTKWDGEVREVTLEPFSLGRYPVTVAEYQKFVEDEETGYRQKSSWTKGWAPAAAEPSNWDEQVLHPNRPVVNVNWYEATAYCEWKRDGIRLPSEAEWEYAARGTSGRRYPWGDEAPDINRANYHDTNVGSASPVGLFPNGATPEGIQDMAGNVLEWTSEQGVRGGDFYYEAVNLRAAVRLRLEPDVSSNLLGFRCVREVIP